MRRCQEHIIFCLSLLCILSSLAGCRSSIAPSGSHATSVSAPSPSVSAQPPNELVGCQPIATVSKSSRTPVSIVSGVVYGGTVCAFAEKYGDDYLTNYVTHDLNLSTDFEQGVDGLWHVSRLDIFPVSRYTTWTVHQAEQICLPFLPADAQHQQQDRQDQYGDITQIYTSQEFAATFLPSSRAYDPTGTIVLNYTAQAAGIFHCNFDEHDV